MPVHIAITRRVRPGCEAEFRQALREFLQTSVAHGGVQGAGMLTPPPGSDTREYGILRTFVGGKIVHSTADFAAHAPTPIPVLPEWSPVKVFGGYGAPLDVRKAARAGVPVAQTHEHSAGCHQHGCAHAAQQLFAGLEAARNRYSGFFGSGCDCFADLKI